MPGLNQRALMCELSKAKQINSIPYVQDGAKREGSFYK